MRVGRESVCGAGGLSLLAPRGWVLQAGAVVSSAIWCTGARDATPYLASCRTAVNDFGTSAAGQAAVRYLDEVFYDSFLTFCIVKITGWDAASEETRQV